MIEGITGIILAGGKGQRLGARDKGLEPFSGRALVDHVIERLRPQVNDILISANRNISDYAERGYPVIPDSVTSVQGPLAGMLSVVPHMNTDFGMLVPCDCPLFPLDLVNRLHSLAQEQQARVVTLHDGGRLQPLFMLFHREMAESLRDYTRRGYLSVTGWLETCDHLVADFSDFNGQFINLNTADDFARILQSMAQQQ